MTAEISGIRAGRGEPATFGPGSMLWDYVGLHISAATSQSAFVLQAMHPAIGAVVDQRSTFRTDPWGRAARSFASVQTWVYGGAEAIAEGHRLRAMHKDLSATDTDGTRHHALSAGPWAWVPLTAFHASVTGLRYFAPRPLEGSEELRLYQEVLQLCRILQVPERMLPPTIAEYWAYFDDMVENVLVPHPTARTVLSMMERGLAPPPAVPAALRRAWAPLGLAGGRLSYFLTVGTLPPAARDKLGLEWSRGDERRLRRIGRAMALADGRMPERVRYMPIAYRARQAARAQEELARALTERPI